MPFVESITALILAAAGAAAVSILAGASATDAANAAASAVKDAETVKQMAEESVLWYSLAGGLIGAISAWALGFLPRDMKEGSKQVLGSALASLIFAPMLLLYFKLPHTLTLVVCISGVIGMVASGVLVKIMPILPALAPAWLQKLLGGKQINTDDYDMSGNRPRSPARRTPRKPLVLEKDEGEEEHEQDGGPDGGQGN